MSGLVCNGMPLITFHSRPGIKLTSSRPGSRPGSSSRTGLYTHVPQPRVVLVDHHFIGYDNYWNVNKEHVTGGSSSNCCGYMISY